MPPLCRGSHDGEHEVAMRESSPAKSRCSLTNSTRAPLRARPCRAHKSSKFRTSQSTLCTTTVSQSRASGSSSVSYGLAVSRPEALSGKTNCPVLELAVLVLVQRAYAHVPYSFQPPVPPLPRVSGRIRAWLGRTSRHEFCQAGVCSNWAVPGAQAPPTLATGSAVRGTERGD